MRTKSRLAVHADRRPRPPRGAREIAWSSRFRIHHRVVQSPRQGHILLVGDAAHVPSPAGGQGINTGLQDSASLAETLAATLQDGDEARLDAWARKRHQIAADVVAFTDRMTRMATLKSRAAQTVRNLAVASAARLPPVRAALANALAELNTR
jgi:2-polyprenyl-6-methoxyphenol hydroxylase-like FAD-dependent oxidoreductase